MTATALQHTCVHKTTGLKAGTHLSATGGILLTIYSILIVCVDLVILITSNHLIQSQDSLSPLKLIYT